MATEEQKLISCSQCKTTPCLYGYPEGMPEWCQANRYRGLLKQANAEYLKPENIKINLASLKVIKDGNLQWTRLEECMEFGKALGVKKVGVACCLGLIRDGSEFVRFLRRAGFEVVFIACTIGGATATDIGAPEEYGFYGGMACNPIAQAKILNFEKTELNFMLGLCVGHDTLFIKHSQAPIVDFAVKDKVACHNPLGPLYSSYHRMHLREKYGKD